MKTRRFPTLLILLALTLITLIAGCPHAPGQGRYEVSLPEGQSKLSLEEMEAESRGRRSKRVYINVQDPNGVKRMWAVSQDAKEPVMSILSVYPQKIREGGSFHAVTSWEDMAKLEAVVHEDYKEMIWSLFNEVSRLKRRVKKLEKESSEHAKGD